MAHIHDFDMLEASGEKEAANFKMARRFSGQAFLASLLLQRKLKKVLIKSV